jgi:hypothetical protein
MNKEFSDILNKAITPAYGDEIIQLWKKWNLKKISPKNVNNSRKITRILFTVKLVLTKP